MAELRSGSARALTGRFLGALDHTAVGDDILPPGETLDVMSLIAEHAAQELAAARHGAQPGARVGVVLLGRLEDGPLDVAAQVVVVTHQCQVDFATLVHGGIGKPRGDAVAMGFVGHLLPKLRQVVVTGRLLHGGEECRPCAPAMYAPTEQVAGRAPGGGLDGGRRQPAPAPQHRHLLRVTLVMLGLPPGDGVHRPRLPEATWKRFAGTQVSQPVPGEEAFDPDDEIRPVRRDGREKWVWASGHMPVQQDLSVPVHDTEVQGASMPINATVTWVRFRVKSQEVSSSFMSDRLPLSAYHRGMLRRGPP